MKDQNPSPPPPPPPAGFSNQQALLLLLICFPLGLIGLGFVVMVTQQVQQQRTPAFREPPSDRVDTSPAPAQPETPSIPSQQSDTGPKTVVERQRPPETGLTMDQARSIVEQWLSAKQQIFAPPFDTSVADRIVANGPLWSDLTKTGGSIDWLRGNDSHYTYNLVRINNVISFTPSSDMPSIVISVTEDSVLHSPRGTTPSRSTNIWTYTLKEEGGTWKLWDYRKE